MEDYPITVYMVPKEILEEAIAKTQSFLSEPSVLTREEFYRQLEGRKIHKVYLEERRKGDRRRG